jgi:hypothetical protein
MYIGKVKVNKMPQRIQAVCYICTKAYLHNKKFCEEKLAELGISFVLLIDLILRGSRVARFFLLKLTQTVKIYQIITKYTKKPLNIARWPSNRPNGHKYTNIFHRKTLQNLPKLVFLV